MKAKARLLQSLKIWMVIYPSITFFLFLFGEHLSKLELYQRTFILTISLVPWMMFVGIPLLDLLLLNVVKGKEAYNTAAENHSSNKAS